MFMEVHNLLPPFLVSTGMIHRYSYRCKIASNMVVEFRGREFDNPYPGKSICII
jgi:hypothetical protein